MLYLDAKQTAARLPWLELVEALRQGFNIGCDAPLRHAHEFEIPNEADGTLLLMPAWVAGTYLGVKQVLVIPDNGSRNLSAVCASYQLCSAKTGQLLAILDGGVLTNRRTAAASALASSYLSRPDSKHLLMVGTGSMSRSLIQAHAAVRPIDKVSVWGRSLQKSELIAAQMRDLGLAATAIEDLQLSARSADVISCATLSHSPLIQGEWLRAGTHLDLVGAFTPTMRECDDEAIRKANVFVDTREGALSEAGDIMQAIESGVLTASAIQADLYDLTRDAHCGRTSNDEITVFKSVGTALEDLAAAVLAYESSVN